MPEQFVMKDLGHNSKAVHRVYARKALVKIPSLEGYKKKAAATKATPNIRGIKRITFTASQSVSPLLFPLVSALKMSDQSRPESKEAPTWIRLKTLQPMAVVAR